MPRDRLTGRRGVGRPGIQAGGFQGGVAVQAVAPQESNLTQLGDALGALSDTTNQTIYQYSEQRARKGKAAKELLEKDASQEADSIRLRMSSLNAEARAGLLLEPDMAKRLEENPYILPMLQKYEGSRQASEAWEGMAEAGVNLDDEEAVNQYLAEATQGRDNPHFAAGFNQEWQRVQAQITQQRVSRDTAALRDGMQNAAAEMLFNSLEDGVEPGEAFKLLKGEEPFAEITGKELTAIQMTVLGRAARGGNLELAMKIAEASRGDAPALINSTEAERVQILLGQAEAEVSRQRVAYLEKYLPAIGDAIAGGISIDELENHPELGVVYDSFTPERQNSLRDKIRARDDKEQKRLDRINLNNRINEIETDYNVDAAAGVLNGTIQEILPLSQEFVDQDGNNRKVSVSESQIRSTVVNALRQKVFPNGVEKTDPQLAVAALNNVTNAGVPVPGFVQAAYSDIARDFDPDRLENLENLDDDEVSNLMSILQSSDPSLRKAILGEGADVWETAVTFMSTRPGKTPKELLQYAARIKGNPMTTSQIQGFTKQVNNMQSTFSLDNAVGKGRATFSAGQFPEFISRPEVQAEFLDVAKGLKNDEMVPALRNFVSSRFAPVHGNLVEMPAVEGETYINPEVWAQSLDAWVSTQATVLAGDERYAKKIMKPGNVRLTRLPGVQGDVYQVIFLEQGESFQLRAPGVSTIRNALRLNTAKVQDAEQKREDEEAKNKAINQSRKRARRRQGSSDEELIDILTD